MKNKEVTGSGEAGLVVKVIHVEKVQRMAAAQADFRPGVM